MTVIPVSGGNHYLILKLLHIVSVIGMIAGLIGRNIVKARTAKVSDIQIMQAFVELGGRFERYLLIPGSLFVLRGNALLAQHKRRQSMYYRVAIQVDPSPTWKWKSTALSSLNILLHWLQYYRVLPHDRLRIFSSSSQEELNEQLVRENQGLWSTSAMATQFLQERMLAQREVVREGSANKTRGNERTIPIAAVTESSLNKSSREAQALDESSRSPLDKRRGELECGAGGDHDLPYTFSLPTSMPQVLAWVKLLVRVQHGDLQREVIAFRELQQ